MRYPEVKKGESKVDSIAFFHVSYSIKPIENNMVILKPRVPAKMYADEGNIPRICVSKNIIGCLKGITEELTKIRLAMTFARNVIEYEESDGYSSYDLWLINPKIYVCTNKIAYLPPKFKDFRKNDEYWYIDETVFHYLGNINIDDLINKNVLSRTLEEECKFFYKSSKHSYDKLTWKDLKGNFELGSEKWTDKGFVM